MAPGDSGALVTIPVVMVSDADGAIIRAQMDAGADVIAFIGNKVGYYAKDGIDYSLIYSAINSNKTPLAGLGIDSNESLKEFFPPNCLPTNFLAKITFVGSKVY